MKECDLSLLFFDSSIFSDIEGVVEAMSVKKKWQGVDCLEVFYEEPITTKDLPLIVDAFLRKPLINRLLNLHGRKALRIGVFFDTANCTVDLNSLTLSQLQQFNLELIFSCYPTA